MRPLTPRATAVIVCDLWDRHWCWAATRRLRRLAPRIEAFLCRAREAGMLVVHCPSGVVDRYRHHPARRRALALVTPGDRSAAVDWWPRDPSIEPPLPIDDSDGGCSCPSPCAPRAAFTAQTGEVYLT